MFIQEINSEIIVRPTFELKHSSNTTNPEFANFVVIKNPVKSFTVMSIRGLYDSKVMITEADINIFIDIFKSESTFHQIVKSIIKTEKLDDVQDRSQVWK